MVRLASPQLDEGAREIHRVFDRTETSNRADRYRLIVAFNIFAWTKPIGVDTITDSHDLAAWYPNPIDEPLFQFARERDYVIETRRHSPSEPPVTPNSTHRIRNVPTMLTVNLPLHAHEPGEHLKLQCPDVARMDDVGSQPPH